MFPKTTADALLFQPSTASSTLGPFRLGLRRRPLLSSPARGRSKVAPAPVPVVDWSAAEIQYGGETFERASSFMRGLRHREPHETRREVIARDLGGVRAVLALGRRLPRLEMSLTDSPSGREMSRYLGIRRRGFAENCFAQGVLPVPDSFDEYLRARRSVRRQFAKATQQGLTCEPLTTLAERRFAVAYWLEQLHPSADPDEGSNVLTQEAPSDAQWLAVFDSDHNPIAYAVLLIDAEWSMLQIMVGLSRPAHWLLHTRLVESLCAANVRYLWTRSDNALLLKPGLQHFQRMLGYRVANLSPAH